MQTINISLIDGYTRFLKDVRKFKEKSLRNYTVILEAVERELGKPLYMASYAGEIEKACVLASQKRKKAFNGGNKDNGEEYLRRAGTYVAKFLKWAHREGFVEKTVYAENTFRRPVKKQARYLSDTEIEKLLNHPMIGLIEHTIMLLLLDTGIRRFELCNIKVNDLDLFNNMLHIPYGKGAKLRTIPFSDKTKFWMNSYLQQRPIDSVYLFPNANGDKLNEACVGTIFQKISYLVGFRVAAHMFRHTTCRLLIEANVNPFTIALYMGHENIETTRQYAHVSKEKLKEANIRINERMQNKAILSRYELS